MTPGRASGCGGRFTRFQAIIEESSLVRFLRLCRHAMQKREDVARSQRCVKKKVGLGLDNPVTNLISDLQRGKGTGVWGDTCNYDVFLWGSLFVSLSPHLKLVGTSLEVMLINISIILGKWNSYRSSQGQSVLGLQFIKHCSHQS